MQSENISRLLIKLAVVFLELVESILDSSTVHREAFIACFAITFFFPVVLKVLNELESMPKHGFMFR